MDGTDSVTHLPIEQPSAERMAFNDVALALIDTSARVPEDTPAGITTSHEEIACGRTPDRRTAADEDDEVPAS